MTDVEPYEEYEEEPPRTFWERWRWPLGILAAILFALGLVLLPSIIANDQINGLEEDVNQLDEKLAEETGRADALEDGLLEANQLLEQLGQPPVPVPEEGVEENDPDPDDPENQDPESNDPDPNDPESQDPEVQDGEAQDAEIQNSEVQDPEVNDLDPFDDLDLFDDPDPDDPDPDDPDPDDPEIQDPELPCPEGSHEEAFFVVVSPTEEVVPGKTFTVRATLCVPNVEVQ